MTLHCDLRVRWKVASDLRFRVAISEPRTPSFSGISGDLALSMRKSPAIAIVRFWCAKVSFNRLSGKIPDAQSLWLMFFSSNKLSGFPDAMGSMTGLFSMIVRFNQLSGKIPDAMGSMMRLNGMDLGINQLSGAIPDAMVSMRMLESIDINSNLLTGTIPLAVAPIPLFRAHHNRLSGSMPRVVPSTFLVSDNQLTGSVATLEGSLVQILDFM